MKQRIKRREVLTQWALCNNYEHSWGATRDRIVNRLRKRNWLREVKVPTNAARY